MAKSASYFWMSVYLSFMMIEPLISIGTHATWNKGHFSVSRHNVLVNRCTAERASGNLKTFGTYTLSLFLPPILFLVFSSCCLDVIAIIWTIIAGTISCIWQSSRLSLGPMAGAWDPEVIVEISAISALGCLPLDFYVIEK